VFQRVRSQTRWASGVRLVCQFMAGLIAPSMATLVPLLSLSAQTPGPPVVALRKYNADNWDRSLCLTSGGGEAAAISCGDLIVTHSLPGFSTLGRDRALTLIHNSATAFPVPMVVVSVAEATSLGMPDSVYVALTIGGSVVKFATYGGWSGGTRQISVPFGAAVTPTGVYPFSLAVTNRYSSGSFTSTVTGQLLVLNRYTSEFGAGFSIAGLEQLIFNQPVGTAAGGILWIGGDGSAKLYSQISGTGGTKWLAPLGAYRDTLTLNTTTGNYTRALRHGVQVVFDASGRHIQTISRTGQVTTFTWNTTTNRLTSITVPPGVTGTTYTLAYVTSGSDINVLNHITDPAGRVLDATIASGRLNTLTDPDGKQVTFTWGGNRQITARTNRRGFTTRYEYAKGQRVTRVIIATGHLPTDPDTAATTLFPWDEQGFLLGTFGQVAVDTAKAYVRILGPRNPSVTDTAAIYVDKWGAPTKIINGIAAVTTISRGDPANPALVTRVVAPNSKIDTLRYNARGNLLEARDSTWHLAAALRLPTSAVVYTYPTTGPAQDSPLTVAKALEKVNSTTYTYATTTYTYNSQGLTDLIVDPRGHNTKFWYRPTTDPLKGLMDSVAEKSVQTWKQSTATEVTRDQVVRFGYNVKGNLQTHKSPVGIITTYVRDGAERVVDVYDPIGTRTNRRYDAMNRLDTLVQYTTAQANPLVAAPLADCDATQVTCSDVTPAAFSPALPAQLVTVFGYNGLDLDTVIDPRGVRRTYKHDGRGLQWQEKDEFTNTGSATFDPQGNAKVVTSRGGQAVQHTYDALGRELSVAYPAVSHASGCHPTPSCVTALTVPGDNIAYTYDDMGNRLTSSNSRGTITRTYYGDGSLKQSIDVSSGLAPDTLMYEYNAARAVTRVVHGWDIRVQHAWYQWQCCVYGDLSVRWLGPPSPAELPEWNRRYAEIRRQRRHARFGIPAWH
jgi:YD repeat-containing protein